MSANDIMRAAQRLTELGIDRTASGARRLAAEAARTRCVAHREGWTVLTSAGQVSRDRDPMDSLTCQLAAQLEHDRRLANATGAKPVGQDQAQHLADVYGGSVVREAV